MKIAIIGTRGIPNNYGGFEQFAEYLSVGLVAKGHDVTVYSSDKHLYKKVKYKGVRIIHKKDPEDRLGTAGQFIYDLNCIIDSRKRHFDVILNLGYTSSSIWMRLFPKSSIVITNMDGLEWKRTKFSKSVQKFLLFAEKLAVRHSDYLVSDSKAIQTYILQKYKIDSEFIAYGATVFNNPDFELTQKYNIKKHEYSLLIARIEPENNIEMILDGVNQSQNQELFFVIGNPSNKFGLFLQDKYKEDERIRFLGPIYDIEMLNNLRYFSKYYFHGHSVGGTNPSLLEAMACNSLIVAHKNPFNESVLDENAIYFSDSEDVKNIMETNYENSRMMYSKNNIQKIKRQYSWEFIIDEYERYMINKLNNE
jgi:glycosyltransferase involved in cell wall biosynthesis